MSTTNKECRKCHENKPATEDNFYFSAHTPDHLHYWCKVCYKAYNKERYSLRKDKLANKTLVQGSYWRARTEDLETRIARLEALVVQKGLCA